MINNPHLESQRKSDIITLEPSLDKSSNFFPQLRLPLYVFHYSQAALQKRCSCQGSVIIIVPGAWEDQEAVGASPLKPSGHPHIPTYISLEYRDSLQWLAVLEVCMSGEPLSSFS